jgi:biofilm PGA synthesis N-glycosyltransferase PgaC
LETYLHEALFILFLICFIIQLYFLVANQKQLSDFQTAETLPAPGIPISVIISARNEAKNLRANLPAILDQKYPDFEVVLVNDCSYDRSEDVLKEFALTYKHLRVVTITEHERFKTGKKFALTLGIKAAKNEHLLFTDADCMPASHDWVTRMAGNFSTLGTQIVLGYSPYRKTKNFLNSIIRYETVKTGINYLSAALRGDAYMGTGRNLAYTKTLFFGNKGFAAHMHILSGDDDLFVNQNATPTNTAIELHPDAYTYTDAKTSLAAWYRQKRRHFGAGTIYKKRHRQILSLDAVSGVFYYILLTLCLVFNFEPLLMAGLFMFRLVFQLIIYTKLFKRLKGKSLLWRLAFLDVFYYFSINMFGLMSTFTKANKWK